jgi:hypothetical protein
MKKNFLRLQRIHVDINDFFTEVSSFLPNAKAFLVVLNWLGYVLLLASALDYLIILYPPQLTNPNWELQAFRDMVNNAWIMLLSLVLIYLPNRDYMRKFELKFLNLFRWGILLAGVLFIFLIPLGLNNTQRINQNTEAQLAREQAARQEQLNNLEQAVKNQDISLAQLQRLGEALGIEENKISENTKAKETLIAEIQNREQQLKKQIETAKRNRFRQLLRQAVRTHFGAFLIGVFLIRLWWESRWVKTIQRLSSR